MMDTLRAMYPEGGFVNFYVQQRELMALQWQEWLNQPLYAQLGTLGTWINRGTAAGVVATILSHTAVTYTGRQVLHRLNFMYDELTNRRHLDEIMDECDAWLALPGGAQRKSQVRDDFGLVTAERDFGLPATAAAANTPLRWFRRCLIAARLQDLRNAFGTLPGALRWPIAFLLFWIATPQLALAWATSLVGLSAGGLLWALSHAQLPLDKHLRAIPYFWLTRAPWDVEHVGTFGASPGAEHLLTPVELPAHVTNFTDVITLTVRHVTHGLDTTITNLTTPVLTTTRRPASRSTWGTRDYSDERGINTGWFDTGILRPTADFRIRGDMHDVLSRVVWRLQRAIALLALTAGTENLVLRVPSELAKKREGRSWHDRGSFFPWTNPIAPAIIVPGEAEGTQSRANYPAYHYWLSPKLRHTLRQIPPDDFPPLRTSVARFIERFLQTGHVADKTIARDLVASDIKDLLVKEVLRRRAWWPSAALGLYISEGTWNATERDIVQAFAVLYGFAVIWADAADDEITRCKDRLADEEDLSMFDKTACESLLRVTSDPGAELTWAWRAVQTLFSWGAQGDARPRKLVVTLKLPLR
jgi:hypothetical protein